MSLSHLTSHDLTSHDLTSYRIRDLIPDRIPDLTLGQSLVVPTSPPCNHRLIYFTDRNESGSHLSDHRHFNDRNESGSHMHKGDLHEHEHEHTHRGQTLDQHVMLGEGEQQGAGGGPGPGSASADPSPLQGAGGGPGPGSGSADPHPLLRHNLSSGVATVPGPPQATGPRGQGQGTKGPGPPQATPLPTSCVLRAPLTHTPVSRIFESDPRVSNLAIDLAADVRLGL
mgnify:CR=1 FL=1